MREAQVQDFYVSPPLPYYTVRKTVTKDYKKGMQWEIDENNKTCTTRKLNSSMPPPCIPANAQFQGTYLLSQTLEVDRWYVDAPAASQATVYEVESKTCWPVSETRRSTVPDKFRLTSLTFENVTAGIKNPGIFNLPSYCPPGK
ncbi:ependymin-related protein 2 [Lingula anatina]|uniref:Ependymin-related protein 2 n=1 Tax=Lingula anatina TaxID=7574 RepID=A0A1S3IY58_LINAN|nr:ependymin-related protein 2 [Lingula anatina]|eukprot:XP_013402963.1 ependymin-related protein 2 [Lingula anatina]